MARGEEEQDPCPILPRFSMSDMLAMAFSLGFVPVLCQVIAPMFSDQQWLADHPQELQLVQAMFFVIALIAFPACFLSTLYRLHLNRVPASLPRLVMLALAPYVVAACWIVIPCAIAAPFVYSDAHAKPHLAVVLGTAMGLMVLGGIAAHIARGQVGSAPAV